MLGLFANADVAAPVVENVSLFPPNFWAGILGTTIYALLAFALFPLAWKVLDWITPGDLNKQLLGTTMEKNDKIGGGQLTEVKHTPDGKPNTALAIVVGFLALGFCIILAAAIH